MALLALDDQGFKQSLWTATGGDAPHCPPLDTDKQSDIAIVGGGFTGLSTALHLAERGVSVIVLEAREPGWGASGRNGGQVISGLMGPIRPWRGRAGRSEEKSGENGSAWSRG